MTDYTLNVFGMQIYGQSPIIYMLLPVFLAIAYLVSCASLYAFVQMFGIVEFSWMNGVYWAIVVGTIGWIFRNGSKSE
jgi:hypothetical protein